jgi:hypothetical protein
MKDRIDDYVDKLQADNLKVNVNTLAAMAYLESKENEDV